MDETMRDDFAAEEKQESGIGQSNLEGKIRISEDVIAQLATKALNSVEGVAPASPGLMANLRLGRKTANGVRILISEGEPPEIVVDAYITVKYGLRIPDVHGLRYKGRQHLRPGHNLRREERSSGGRRGGAGVLQRRRGLISQQLITERPVSRKPAFFFERRCIYYALSMDDN